MARVVISTIGRDRPGIVNELSQTVFSLGLSIEDSRMTVLGGEFAVLMSVVGDEPALAELDQRLTELAQAADFAYLSRQTAERTTAHNLPCRVRVVAMDHPGIVHGIASFFSARNINIRELETETEHAPHTGTPIFNLTMTVEVPHGTKVAQLRNEFAAFCEEQDLDGALNVPL
jgi:glycine cleavage system transcriptional repressor